jgi:hypothetical protein
MEHYEVFLSGGSDLTVISGDFNSSVFWDKPKKRKKFGDFMDQIEPRGFVSAYHRHHGCERGAEPHPILVTKEHRRDLPHRLHVHFPSGGDRSRRCGFARGLDLV